MRLWYAYAKQTHPFGSLKRLSNAAPTLVMDFFFSFGDIWEVLCIFYRFIHIPATEYHPFDILNFAAITYIRALNRTNVADSFGYIVVTNIQLRE